MKVFFPLVGLHSRSDELHLPKATVLRRQRPALKTSSASSGSSAGLSNQAMREGQELDLVVRGYLRCRLYESTL